VAQTEDYIKSKIKKMKNLGFIFYFLSFFFLKKIIITFFVMFLYNFNKFYEGYFCHCGTH
jgi:hypothetical protein